MLHLLRFKYFTVTFFLKGKYNVQILPFLIYKTMNIFILLIQFNFFIIFILLSKNKVLVFITNTY